MPSVASQIRIDILASAAGAKAGLREAGSELGSFASQVEAFDRKFESLKAKQARGSAEGNAWSMGMGDLKGEAWKKKTDAEYQKFMQTVTAMQDQMLQAGKTGNGRQIRLNDLLPFGTAMRTSISHEAAEMAATIGDGKTKVMAKLREAAGEMANKSGLGGLVSAAGALASNPFALGGAAVVAGATGLYRASESRREDARSAMHSAAILGTGVEDASRLNAVGFDTDLGTHFQRSMHERKDSFKDLGLDADKLATKPLTEALATVGDALAKTKNPADRAAAAMELFGKSGAEVIPIITNLRSKLDNLADFQIVDIDQATRTRKYDSQKKLTGEAIGASMDTAARAVGADEGFGNSFMRGAGNLFAMTLNPEDRAKYFAKQSQNDDAAEKAKLRDAHPEWAAMEKSAKEKAEADKKAREEQQRRAKEANASLERMDTASFDGVANARLADREGHVGNAARNRDIEESGRALGWSPKQIRARQLEMQDNDRMSREVGQAASLATRRVDPMEQYRRDQAAIDTWRTNVAPGRKGADAELAAMQRQSAKDLIGNLGIKSPIAEFNDAFASLLKAQGTVGNEKLQRAAAELADRTIAALDEPFMKAQDRFAAHMKAIDDMEGKKAYSPEQAAARRDAEKKSELAGLGIVRPLNDFEEKLKRLAADRASGKLDMSDDEYDKARNKLRRDAVDASTADVKTVSPIAAMQAGSQAAFSLLIGAQLSDPKVVEAQKTNRLLDKIEKKLPGAPQRSAGKTWDN